MDPDSACRLAIRVPAYVEQRPDGLDDYHVTNDYMRVVDKDTFGWMDLVDMLKKDIVYGRDQELAVSYFDQKANEFVNLDSDASLLAGFDMYWHIRRLSILVVVKDTGPRLLALTAKENANCVVGTQQSQVEEAQNNDTFPCHTTDPNLPKTKDKQKAPTTANTKAPTTSKPNVDAWGEWEEDEYLGVDDEKSKYKDLVSDDEVEDVDYYSDSDEEDNDPLSVDDEKGCEHVLHVTDLENPKIEEGVNFEDGICFKRCIRHYAVLNEVQLAVPYSESTRYRAYCKAKMCKWRIHASQLQDGRTWMVCFPC